MNDYENRELNKRSESRRIKGDLRFSGIQERCAIFGRTVECTGANYAVEDRADRRSLRRMWNLPCGETGHARSIRGNTWASSKRGEMQPP